MARRSFWPLVRRSTWSSRSTLQGGCACQGTSGACRHGGARLYKVLRRRRRAFSGIPARKRSVPIRPWRTTPDFCRPWSRWRVCARLDPESLGVGRRADCQGLSEAQIQKCGNFTEADPAVRVTGLEVRPGCNCMSSAVPVRHEEGEHPHERLDECRHPISVDRDFVVLAPTLTLTRPGMATRRPSAFIAGAYLALRSPTSHATPVIDVASPWAKDLDTLSISPSEPRTTGRTSSLANQAARDMPSLSHPLSPNLQHAVTSPGALSCGLFEAFAICSRCQRGTLSAPSPSRCGQQRRLTARTAYSMFFSSSGLPPVVALRSRHDRVPVREDDHDVLPDQHSRLETFLLSRQLSGLA